jgi:hypothetical protein
MSNDNKIGIKILRRLATREGGVDIHGVRITSAIIKQHLDDANTGIDVDALVDPSDRQNACLAFTFLKALAELPDAPPGSTPTYCLARGALKTLGSLAFQNGV